MSDPIRDQYESYPYPPRAPEDERVRLITGSPSHILEIDHYVFAGRRNWTLPFRTLIAGGGTGDATVMLAQQLALRGTPAEIVHLDISEAAIAIARARAAARGLDHVRFLCASIQDFAALGLGAFDYIDCCGVLHHMEDPQAGLAALAAALAPAGGIGIMVYAPYGRTGVYPAQAMLRMIATDSNPAQRVATAKRLLAALPPTNWLARNPALGDHAAQGDAGIFDLLLHGRDRAFAVSELAELVGASGLRIAGLLPPLRYEPAAYLRDPLILDRLAELSIGARAAFAELLAGNIKTHVVYAVRAENSAETVARPDAAATIPILRDPAEATLGDGALIAEFDGLKLKFALPPGSGPILRRVDGRASLAAICAACASEAGALAEWSNFKALFDRLYAVMNGLDRMFLRRP